jgi:antitoxin component YwqK of YwqJK toxin-antitoxin module
MKRLILYPLALLVAFGFYFLSKDNIADIETSELRKVAMKNGVAYDWRTDKPLHGRLIERNSNGKVIAKVTYSNGRLDGLTEYFYDNGTRKAAILYQNGLEHGNWKYFDRDGVLIKNIYYQDGQLIEQ